jgi:diacylglycerol O-acyltransferase / wax synthase
MQVGAILLLAPGRPPTLAGLREAMAERVAGIPRLRQRLVRPPPGCGRPIWVDDGRFDITSHVRAESCPPPGDEEALLAVAAQIVTEPLPAGRPLWSFTLVSDLSDGGCALVVIFHHVLADGIGGLAVLAGLVDGMAVRPAADFPRPSPLRRRLLADAIVTWVRSVARLPGGLRRVRTAIAELRAGGTGRAPRCSLNRPVGRERRLAVARADLEAVRTVAHAHGATVNDVMLTAVTGALRTLLRHRGERVDRFVVSIPASARTTTTVSRLGNQVGVIPVDLPAAGPSEERLEAIAGVTRVGKSAPREAATALMAWVSRAMAWLGVLRWFLNHQPLITTFVSNLRGPAHQVSILGATVTGIVPMNGVAGNVTVAFGVLSYAGVVTVTVVADRDAWPDLPVLTEAVQHELDRLAVRSAGTVASPRRRVVAER